MSFEIVRLVFIFIGLINGVFLFLAPMITFKKIISSKSTLEFSAIPYVLTLLNFLVTGWYSITSFYLQMGGIVFLVDMAGAGIELIYVIIFIVFAPKREKGKIFGILGLVLSLFGTISVMSVFVLKFNGARLFCGFAMVMSSVAMYASPLSVMRMVIRTKSTEFMPFFLSLFVLIYAISWFIIGLLHQDPFLAVGSGLGTGLGIIQLIMYARYRNNPAEKYSKFAKGSLDIGLSQTHLQKQSDSNLESNTPV